MQLAPLLKIGRGVTAFVGAGGKTTLLLTIAQELKAQGSVILCTTTKMYPPEGFPLLTGESEDAVREALLVNGSVCLGCRSAEGKLCAPAISFERMAELADYVLTEADGSRGLPLKAHGSNEPVLPQNVQRVVTVVGVDGFGHRIAEVCHRSALYAERCGASEQDTVQPLHHARVLRTEGGCDRVFINKVETAEEYAAAAALAALLPCPVTAGSLKEGVYVCLH